MSYKAEIYNVMLASPSDVNDERKIARDIINDWNNVHSATRKIVLIPLSWEHNSVPSMRDRPQKIINEQLLKNADILVGIFWTRIGTPTGKAISGTVEEIEEHIESGKQTMLYFSQKPVVPDSIDSEQYKAVVNLKKEYQKKGLTTDFDSSEDFKTKFQRHLSMKLNEAEYITASIEIGFNGNESKTAEIKYDLSEGARILLKEASLDPNGEIMKMNFIGGTVFETNGKQLNEDNSPRTKAKWDSAINELLANGLISMIGYKGEIFQLTDIGYKIVDEIK